MAADSIPVRRSAYLQRRGIVVRIPNLTLPRDSRTVEDFLAVIERRRHELFR